MSTAALSYRSRADLQVLPYALSLFPTVLVVAGNLLGGYYALSYTLFALLVLCLLDWIVPSCSTPPVVRTSDTLPTVILLISVVCHTASVGSLWYGVYASVLTDKFIWFGALSTGFNSGILGITAGHELIHRKDKWLQYAGIWNLFLANYTHFYIEHRLGHHVRVGTWDDPVTARYNEGFYRFLLRAIPGQIRSAWHIEARRLAKKGIGAFSWQHFLVRSFVIQLLVVVILYLAGGSVLAAAHLVQSIAGIFLLEFVNYIEHYGLVRAKGEKVTAMHAWQSDRISSRFMLYELSRHSDHHLKAHKPFHTLDSHPEAYVLPSGYFGMFYIGLFPPLWFRVMNPILDKKKS